MLGGVVTRFVDVAERRARLAVRHRHVAATHADDVVAVTDGLVALHSTDPVSVYLSAAARMATPSLAAVDAALYAERSLVRHHAMRRTLWVFGHEAARLAHHAATVDVARVQRRLALTMLGDGGIARPEEWLASASTEILALLEEEGPLSAREIGLRLPALAVPLSVGSGSSAATIAAHSRVLLLLGFDGRVVRARPTGTWINGQYRWAATSTWWPDGFGAVEPRAAAAGLARRWLAAFGPGTRADLAWWAAGAWASPNVRWPTSARSRWRSTRVPASCCPTTSIRCRPHLRRRCCCPGSTRRRWVGSSAPSTWHPRTPPCCSTATATAAPRRGSTAGSSAGGTSAPTARSRCTSRPTSAVRPCAALDQRAAELAALLGDVRFRTRFPAPLQAKLA